MLLRLLAGPVISNELYYTIIFASLIAIITVLTLVIYILKKVLPSKKPLKKKAFSKSFLLSSMIILSAVLIFLIIPTVIKDTQWERKQINCANEAGYASPSDDNNPNITTFYSQSTYRNCLDK
jgi:hypothetical protein